jgi:hypothetical protein
MSRRSWIAFAALRPSASPTKQGPKELDDARMENTIKLFDHDQMFGECWIRIWSVVLCDIDWTREDGS